MTNRVLLTGAGFSRNWGGWLGIEVLEFLLSSNVLSDRVRQLLWRHRRDGFEYVLGLLQQGITDADRDDLRRILDTLVMMFDRMNAGFTEPLNPQGSQSVTSFLGSFDAIFTLNQDLLIETHYKGRDGLGGGWHRPGVNSEEPGLGFASRWYVPDPGNLRLGSDQPYIKLHGSSDFRAVRAGGAGPMLIQGAGKADAIATIPLLAFYKDLLRQFLSRPDTRLMIIGYSFGDPHINAIIHDVAAARQLNLFIVDPHGAEILDRREPYTLGNTDPNADLIPYVRGASRRPFRETFAGGSSVELTKFSQFFAQWT